METEVLRQIGNSIVEIARTQDMLATDLRDVRERVIRIEAAEYKSVIAELKLAISANATRLAELEKERNQVVGATTFLGWISRHAPWIAAVIVAGITYFRR